MCGISIRSISHLFDVPLGQVNYTSRATHTTKYLSVASINSVAECVLTLYHLLEVLEEVENRKDESAGKS